MAEQRVSTLGRQVAKYRRETKISAEELAERAGTGLTRSIVANLENGRKADLTVQQLLAVAFVLGVSPADLVFDIRDPYDRVALGDTIPLKPAQWLAREWFGGRRIVPELDDAARFSPDLSEYRNARDADTIWLFQDLLRDRDSSLYALTAHEERVADLTSRTVSPEDARHPSLGDDLDALRARIKEWRAELYDLDRRLRSNGVNLDRPAIHPGAPF